MQPFTPPSLTPSQNPATPGSSHKSRAGLASGGPYALGQSPTTPSQLGSSRGDAQIGEDGQAGGGKAGSKAFKKLTIKQSLQRFESVLANLVESVSKFRPSVQSAEELIAADDALVQSIAELVEHQLAAQNLVRLRKVSVALDEQLNSLLVTLADCRRTLRGLPRPHEKYLKAYEQQKEANADPASTATVLAETVVSLNPRVSAQDLLNYATKITKFTSAPPGYNQAAPEHANFPWPTEDEMRKGMLALSAIAGTSDTDKEAEPASTATTEKPADDASSSTATTAGTAPAASNGGGVAPERRRSSLVDYGNQRPDVGQPEPSATASKLDLDLFDPDDDDEEDEDDNMEDV